MNSFSIISRPLGTQSSHKPLLARLATITPRAGFATLSTANQTEHSKDPVGQPLPSCGHAMVPTAREKVFAAPGICRVGKITRKSIWSQEC